MNNWARINNNIEANEGWRKLCWQAHQCGYIEIIVAVCPKVGEGWRKTDKAIAEFCQRIAGDGI